MSVNFWITTVAKLDGRKPDTVLQDLIGREKIYALRDGAKGLDFIKSGDWICFYIPKNGVVAHARLSTGIERKDLKSFFLRNHPWIFGLDNVNIYLNDRTIIDAEMRGKLDAFKGKNLNKIWSWFVQSTHRITRHDFDMLVKYRVPEQLLEE